MRKKTTVTKQQKQIDARVASIRAALEGNPLGWMFGSTSHTECAYLMGASHALRWAKNENVYEPASFKVFEDKKTGKEVVA